MLVPQSQEVAEGNCDVGFRAPASIAAVTLGALSGFFSSRRVDGLGALPSSNPFRLENAVFVPLCYLYAKQQTPISRILEAAMEQTQPKPFAFVLMPFAAKFADLYELGIKAACIDAGAYCERVDEQLFLEGILSRIYNQIAKADVVVAVMTGRNPNVFYEVGYAHALGKREILVTQKAEDIPFDLKHYSHILYGGRIVELKAQLQKRIEWCIANPNQPLARADIFLKVFLDGKELGSNSEVNRYPSNYCFLNLALHNPGHQMYPKGSLQIGIVSTNEFSCCYEHNPNRSGGAFGTTMELPEHKKLHMLSWWSEVIFPSAWVPLPCQLNIGRVPQAGEVLEFILRLFTELGAIDIPFRVKYQDTAAESGSAKH